MIMRVQKWEHANAIVEQTWIEVLELGAETFVQMGR